MTNFGVQISVILEFPIVPVILRGVKKPECEGIFIKNVQKISGQRAEDSRRAWARCEIADCQLRSLMQSLERRILISGSDKGWNKKENTDSEYSVNHDF